jgi:hypothetical protein
MIAINFILKNWKWIVSVLIVGLLIYFISRSHNLKDDNNRQAGNVRTIRDSVQILNLKVGEYKNLQFKDKSIIDSLFKASNLKPRNVEKVTIINTVFKDTGSVKVVYRDVIKQPDNSFKIPVSFSSLCWSMRGAILSRDSLSRLDILERSANNSASLIVTKQRRFLWILWVTHKAEYKLNSECGKTSITDITFVK